MQHRDYGNPSESGPDGSHRRPAKHQYFVGAEIFAPRLGRTFVDARGQIEADYLRP
jgi:hypothetical protein